VFENRVLRRIFGPKRVEVIGEWKKKLHSEELNDPYSSLNIVRMIKSRRTRWAGHVARTEKRKGVYRGLVGNVIKRDHLEDPGLDGSIVLSWILRKWDVELWTGSI